MMDIEEAVQEYLFAQQRLRPLTRKGYEQRLEVFCQWVVHENKQREKPIELETLNAGVIDRFVAYLQQEHTSSYKGKPISTYTLAGYVRVLKIFLAWCQDDEAYESSIKASTLRKIKLPKREQFIIATFTDAQLIALKEATDNEYNEHLRLRDKCILALLLSTGLRADELCTLTLQHLHLDLAQPYIKVHGKGNKWREIPLIDLNQVQDDQLHAPQSDHQAREMLQRFCDEYRSRATPTETVFIGRYHEPLTTDGLGTIIDRLGTWAKIEGVRCSPHDFRHSFAIRFMLIIGDVYLLSKLMGHSSIKTTEEYLKSFSGQAVRLALFKKLNGEK